LGQGVWGAVVSEAEKIAAGLSEAQREALAAGTWNADPVCADLMLAGIIKKAPTVSWPYYVELTPKGLEVRTILERQSHD
jgi:hypothetical protein